MRPSLADAEAALRHWFGYPSLRAPQRRAIAAVLRGRDTLVVMPTGGGKSLCFQIPALVLPRLTVVLSPLVSLMKDQVDTLVRKGIPAVALHGGMSGGEQADAVVRVVGGHARLLYVAPERMVAGRTLDLLRRVPVSLLAVDEAHCISEWGHDFRPAYRALQAIRAPLGGPPVIALTATATPEVQRDIAAVCGMQSPVRIVAGFDRPNLRYVVHRVSRPGDRESRLMDRMARGAGAVVVYAQSRARVERLATSLRSTGVNAVPYHAGQDATLRRETQDRFMRGDADVIVATSAFGMGVDKPDVRLVVHDAIAPSLESYYQEAGRAGRDGHAADCVLFYSRADRRSPEYFIAAANPPRAMVSAVYAAACQHAAGRVGNHVDAAAVASRLRLSPAVVAGCLAILAAGGALIDEPADLDAIWVRLLATNGRIKTLRSDDDHHRHLLRALWSVSGGRVRRGATINTADLPPGLGGVALPAALDSLMRDAVLVWSRPGGGRRLVSPSARLDAFAIDWERLDATRAIAAARLAAMVRYAEAHSCRRRVMLEYFGEQAVAANCGNCDRCR